MPFGQKALFVNRTFTTRINELLPAESDAVLTMLFEQAEHIDHQIRFRWTLNDMAFWDNRCCMHRAIWDYWPVIPDGAVHAAAIVPECHVVQRPAKPDLMIDMFSLFKQHGQHGIAFSG